MERVPINSIKVVFPVRCNGANVVINRKRPAYFQTIGINTVDHCPAFSSILGIWNPKVMAIKLHASGMNQSAISQFYL